MAKKAIDVNDIDGRIQRLRLKNQHEKGGELNDKKSAHDTRTGDLHHGIRADATPNEAVATDDDNVLRGPHLFESPGAGEISDVSLKEDHSDEGM